MRAANNSDNGRTNTPAWNFPIALRFLRRLIMACLTRICTLQTVNRFGKSFRNTIQKCAPHYLPMLYVCVRKTLQSSVTRSGVPFHVFSKLYDSIIWPVISYSAPIWGANEYTSINAVQTRAMIYFLGVGKYTPNAAVYGEMAWEPPIVKQ